MLAMVLVVVLMIIVPTPAGTAAIPPEGLMAILPLGKWLITIVFTTVLDATLMTFTTSLAAWACIVT